MPLTFFRLTALLGGVLAIVGVGVWYLGGNDHLGIPLLIGANALVGAVQAFRMYPFGRGLESGSFYSRPQTLDLAWLAAVQFGGSIVIALLLALSGSAELALIWMPLFVLAVGFGLGFPGGLLVGMMLLVPVVTLVTALVGRLLGRPAGRGDVLGSLLIVSILPPIVLGALAMDFGFSQPKAAAWAMLFALAGPILPGIEVRSDALLWLGRLWFVALIVFVVLFARRGGRRAEASAAPRARSSRQGSQRRC